MVNRLHPAADMATTMVRQSGVKPLSTVEEGAQTILNLEVSEELDGRSGEFLAHLEHRPAAGSESIEAPNGLVLAQISMTFDHHAVLQLAAPLPAGGKPRLPQRQRKHAINVVRRNSSGQAPTCDVRQ
jgi:hypothetical protein